MINETDEQIRVFMVRPLLAVSCSAEAKMSRCPFCQIAQEGLPPHGLFEDQSFFVILDRESLGFGHCMVVPKRHVVKIYELDERESVAFFALAQKVARHLERVLAVKAVGYVALGSGLPHAHLHLIPHNDARVLMYPHEFVKRLSDEELRVGAEKLRSLLPKQLLPASIG